MKRRAVSGAALSRTYRSLVDWEPGCEGMHTSRSDSRPSFGREHAPLVVASKLWGRVSPGRVNRDFLFFDFENAEHCTPVQPSDALLDSMVKNANNTLESYFGAEGSWRSTLLTTERGKLCCLFLRSGRVGQVHVIVTWVGGIHKNCDGGRSYRF